MQKILRPFDMVSCAAYHSIHHHPLHIPKYSNVSCGFEADFSYYWINYGQLVYYDFMVLQIFGRLLELQNSP